jgi:hypothetical protein
LVRNLSLEKQLNSLLRISFCANRSAFIHKTHEKEIKDEQPIEDCPQCKILLSLHSNPRSGCTLRRGQVHRSRLTAVCAKRNAMAHELIVGILLCGHS